MIEPTCPPCHWRVAEARHGAHELPAYCVKCNARRWFKVALADPKYT